MEMETEYKKLNVKAKRCMRLSALLSVGLLMLAAALIRLAVHIGNVLVPLWVDIAFAVLLALGLLFIIAAPAIRYKRYKYFIDDEKLIVVEGLWFISKTIAPIERVHQISIERGPVDRLYGLSKVVATTAGGNIVVRFLENNIAEEMAESLGIRIGTIVKAQRGENHA